MSFHFFDKFFMLFLFSYIQLKTSKHRLGRQPLDLVCQLKSYDDPYSHRSCMKKLNQFCRSSIWCQLDLQDHQVPQPNKQWVLF